MNFGDDELLMKGRYVGGANALMDRERVATNPVANPTMESPGSGTLLMGPGANLDQGTPPESPPTMEMVQASPGMPWNVQASAQQTGQPGGGSDWPDWMTEDDQKFANNIRQMARNYKGRIEKRRQNRAMTSEYNKLSRARDVARGNMEILAGIMKSQPDLYFEEDGQTPNAHGMALLRQLGQHRERYKQIKTKEADFLKQMSDAGLPIPQGKDELGDEELAAIGTHGDREFDDWIGLGVGQLAGGF